MKNVMGNIVHSRHDTRHITPAVRNDLRFTERNCLNFFFTIYFLFRLNECSWPFYVFFFLSYFFFWRKDHFLSNILFLSFYFFFKFSLFFLYTNGLLFSSKQIASHILLKPLQYQLRIIIWILISLDQRSSSIPYKMNRQQLKMVSS